MDAYNTLSISVKFRDDCVTREFDPSYKNSEFGTAFTKIFEDTEFVDRLANTFREVHRIESPDLNKLLFNDVFKNANEIFGEQPVPWYLNEFYNAVRKAHKTSRYSMYLLTVKACRDFYFYKLEGKMADGVQLIHIPFFQKATPPTSRTEEIEKVRGLADTVLFLAPKLLKITKDELLAFISWFNIKLQCQVTRNDMSEDAFTLTINPDIDSSKYISLPPKDERILVASPNVRDAIANLSEVWLNPTAKSVLLSAWTGSVK